MLLLKFCENFIIEKNKKRNKFSLPENLLQKAFCEDHSRSSMGYRKSKIHEDSINLLSFSVNKIKKNLLIKNLRLRIVLSYSKEVCQV